MTDSDLKTNLIDNETITGASRTCTAKYKVRKAKKTFQPPTFRYARGIKLDFFHDRGTDDSDAEEEGEGGGEDEKHDDELSFRQSVETHLNRRLDFRSRHLSDFPIFPSFSIS